MKSDDAATWADHAAAQAWAAANAPGMHDGGGIGLMLGEVDVFKSLGGIDWDSCRDAEGNFTSWAREGMDSLASYSEISPSGTGAKTFFTYDTDAFPALREALGGGEKWGRAWKLPGDNHPPGIELYLGRRYFTVTGAHIESTPLQLRHMTPATVRRIIEEIGPALTGKPTVRDAVSEAVASGPAAAPVPMTVELLERVHAAARESPRLNRRINRDWVGTDDESRSAKAFALLGDMKAAGFGFAEAATVVCMHADTREWAAEKGCAHDFRELRRGFDRSTLRPVLTAENAASAFAAAGPLPAGDVAPARPPLHLKAADLPSTARELCGLLAQGGAIYQRGGDLVRVVPGDGAGVPSLQRLGAHGVINAAHEVCQPVAATKEGKVGVTLPKPVAELLLAMPNVWTVPHLDGITTAPTLGGDGSITSRDGYDPAARMWCTSVRGLTVPDRPTRDDAAAALTRLRGAFRTFPFADADRRFDPVLGVELVDMSTAPGGDESAFLCGLLTAVARTSLRLAPALKIGAPKVSGAGSGKGLLARAIAGVAFGIAPSAFTAGADRAELEKRIVSGLLDARPMLFLDNVNAQTLSSAALASAITERPAQIRELGHSRMLVLNPTAFIVVTGNALSIGEDLARRFLLCGLDARIEDAESRPFPPGFLADIAARRLELLSAALTIWRWGRQNRLARGRPLGSFEDWAAWVRDPLLSLGCADPVPAMLAAKADDPHRVATAEIFRGWHAAHGDAWMAIADLSGSVLSAIDSTGRPRQYFASSVQNLSGTRAEGFVLERTKSKAKWGTTRYRLRWVGEGPPPPRTVPQPPMGAVPAGWAAPPPPLLPPLPPPSGMALTDKTPVAGRA